MDTIPTINLQYKYYFLISTYNRIEQFLYLLEIKNISIDIGDLKFLKDIKN